MARDFRSSTPCRSIPLLCVASVPDLSDFSSVPGIEITDVFEWDGELPVEHGSFGDVWQAWPKEAHLRVDVPVAVKKINILETAGRFPGVGPELAEREAAAAIVLLRDKHIIRILDVFMSEGWFCKLRADSTHT